MTFSRFNLYLLNCVIKMLQRAEIAAAQPLLEVDVDFIPVS